MGCQWTETAPSQATTCPDDFPKCDSDRDCIIASCAWGGCSWTKGSNYIDGDDGSGSACTGDYPRVTFSKRKVYTIENVNAAGKYMNVDASGGWWYLQKGTGRNIHLWDDPERENTQWRIAEIATGRYTLE